VGLDLLAQLDLLLVALLGVELCAQAAEVLGFFRGIVAFSGGALTGALVVVEAAGSCTNAGSAGCWAIA
jgi:hypothetical protein